MKIDSYRLKRASVLSAPYSEQRMGTLVIWFAALILLEGILRKWLLTPIEQPLLFIREPVLFLIYYYYAKDFGINIKWFIPYMVFSSFIGAFALLQAIYWEYPLLVPLLGIRFYLFYIPLAFIMGEVLSKKQISRLLRFLLLSSIPLGIIVFFQFISPVASPINKGLSNDVEGRFTVVADVVRPYGFFTFVAPQVNWAAFLLAIIIICWENFKSYNLPKWLLFSSMISILTMGALSGARTYFVMGLIIAFFYILAGLISSNILIGIKRISYILSLILIFLVIFVVAVPKAYESMSQRQESAISSEGSTFNRAIDSLADVVEPIETAPILGYGIGAGSNAGNAVRGQDNLSLGETEWARMINEIGIAFGYPILLIRIILVIYLGILAIFINKRTGNGAGLILFGFVMPLLLVGQITMQNQLMAICWFAVGLQLALSNKSNLNSTI